MTQQEAERDALARSALARFASGGPTDVLELRLSVERLLDELAGAERERDQARDALRKAYPYVMDALREAMTGPVEEIIREDLERFIVPALAVGENATEGET